MINQGSLFLLTMENIDNIEKLAGQALLEQGIPFKLRNGRIKKFFTGKEFTSYELKPLKTGTLIHVSTITSEIPELDGEKSLISLASESPDLYRKILTASAMAILNDEFLIPLRSKLLVRKLKGLNTSELFTLWAIITKQMGVEAFFFTINLIKGKNLMTTQDIKAAKASGGLSAPQ